MRTLAVDEIFVGIDEVAGLGAVGEHFYEHAQRGGVDLGVPERVAQLESDAHDASVDVQLRGAQYGEDGRRTGTTGREGA